MKTGFWKIKDQVTAAGMSMSPAAIRLPIFWYGMSALIVGVILARWIWIIFAPHVLSVLPPESDTAGNQSAAIFGMLTASGVTGSVGETPVSGMRLIGVFTGKQGFAVFRLGEKHQLGVALGEDISNGIKLVEVASDHVLLELNGVQQRLEMENKFASSKYPVTASQPSSIAPNSEKIVKIWNQAQQEMQKGSGSLNAR